MARPKLSAVSEALAKSSPSTSLRDKLLKAGSVNAEILEDSFFFSKDKKTVVTDIPIINIAFAGSLKAGFSSGITMFVGESKSFKTLLALMCLKAYFDKYPDAVCLFYDSEYGTTSNYLKTFGIDPSRIIHIPILHVEEMKFDMIKRLVELKRGDHVFFLVDSLGALPSKKELDDAHEEKSVADMTRSRAIRSCLRIINPHFNTKDLPCFIINHMYMTMEMFSKVVIPGGQAATLIPNQIFNITKSQVKDADNKLAGYVFTINIHKSRTVREKAKLPFKVTYEGGISKYSGLLDIAQISGHVIKPKNGWYQKVINGVVAKEMFKEKNTDTGEFWKEALDDPSFNSFVEKKFMLGEINMVDDTITSVDEDEA
jgi:RecA/RadA recombinase